MDGEKKSWRVVEQEPVAHAHEEPEEFVPDSGIEAYITTVTLSLVHSNELDPYKVVAAIAETVEDIGFDGVVTGVSTVELRGAGGLLGL